MRMVFVFMLLAIFAGCSHQAKEKELGYVETKKVPADSHYALQVYDELMKDPSVTLRMANGWSIVEKKEGEKREAWAFPPKSHPGYPTVIKRVFLRVNGILDIATTVHCAAKKEVCDKIVMEFVKINRQLKIKEVENKK